MSDTRVKKNGPALDQNEGAPRVQRRVTYTPPVDILELANELVLTLDMPGVKANDVEVHFERGELVVTGTRHSTGCQAGECLVAEHEPATYSRAFLISQDVDVEKISAELKNGVLTVRLPKSSAALPRRIAVNAS
jgi:HSP20 family protein